MPATAELRLFDSGRIRVASVVCSNPNVPPRVALPATERHPFFDGSNLDESTFWEIIESGLRRSKGDPDDAVEGIRSQLVGLQPAAIESFQQLLNAKLNFAYSSNLWGAAYIINGGCSDDGFEYFRCWLISRGRKIFDNAVANPDSLADVVDRDESDEEHEAESLLYVAREAYEKVAGRQMALAGRGHAPQPTGEQWDFDDHTEASKRLPRLSSMYR